MSTSVQAAPPIVLSFAASDPTGGAGLQADLLTLAALGCHPMSVVTAITAQDTRGVAQLWALERAWIEEQARLVLEDARVAAFKAGVLGSAANARAVGEIVARHADVPFVVDPVLASGRGDPLASDDAIAALREAVLPRTTVLTPNSLEARRLARGARELRECAQQLVDAGCRYVLVTGTHEGGAEVVNTLYDQRGVVREDRWPRLPADYHGSGCTLASAIAARLAHGASVADAVGEAQDFTWHALAAGFAAGRGQRMPNRFHRR
ncbi:MAG: hydroxymethylpyrimidine/phosphomethylpyrimidine kinase [Betaproteobacteria bacterium]|nr:hydroxymethylpyrimidine/phosphomethylpyrimidine kinase [Betaproteobacteria bacterium]